MLKKDFLLTLTFKKLCCLISFENLIPFHIFLMKRISKEHHLFEIEIFFNIIISNNNIKIKDKKKLILVLLHVVFCFAFTS